MIMFKYGLKRNLKRGELWHIFFFLQIIFLNEYRKGIAKIIA